MLQRKKLKQAISILNELNVDMWIISGRETGMNKDPVLTFISTIDFSSLMAIIITKKGDTIALVGHNDEEGVKQTSLYNKVIGYDTSFDGELFTIIDQLRPSRIALNYSDFDVSADGLTHGLFLRISKIISMLKNKTEIISSEDIIFRIRGCKLKDEIERIEGAVETAQKIYQDARQFIRSGVTEKEIFLFFQEAMSRYKVEPAWEPSQCPGVMVGPHSVVGHNAPTDIRAKKGDVITIDFGVRQSGYCSDLQRVYYILRDDEDTAPIEVTKAFNVIQGGIRAAARLLRPGAKVYEVDKAARDYIVNEGFPSWNYALGHEIGRYAHDGGLLLAPKWERYEERMFKKSIEEGMVFTLEPGIKTSHGFVGQEEVAYVSKDGGIMISEQQSEIFLCK